jgi:hypothetical protein
VTPPVRPLKIAIIAGEPSGDRLGADLLSALKMRHPEGLEIIGVGGDAMIGEGLSSLFDYSELSIVGVSAVLARLPQLIWRIGQTARAIVAARPDVLVIIDSPDFSHRVARKVRKRLPDLPIVNYVCPTVWAWKPHRAKQMVGYVDHVLSILPFEPRIVAALGGPPTTYVGHRLALDPDLLSARIEQDERAKAGAFYGPLPRSSRLPAQRTEAADARLRRSGRRNGRSSSRHAFRASGRAPPCGDDPKRGVQVAGGARYRRRRGGQNGAPSQRPTGRLRPPAPSYWNWLLPAFRASLLTNWIRDDTSVSDRRLSGPA